MEKIKRIIFNIILTLLLFTLQTGFFERISLGGIVPNLLLILIVSNGLMNDEYVGMFSGFACGLLVDIFFMSAIGYHAMVYTYLGYFSGLLHKYYFPQDVRLPVFLVIGADLLQSLIYYLIFFLLNGEFDFGYYFVHIILAELVYTLGIAIILYPLMMLLEYKVIRIPLWRKKTDA